MAGHKLRDMAGKDFDEEFEKFMNEPISDDSHSVVSPRHKRGQSIERSQTIESVKASDEFSLPDTRSFDKSPSPVEKRPYDSITEENESYSVKYEKDNDNEDGKVLSALKTQDDVKISKDSLEHGFVNESYSAAETSKTDTMQLVNKYADQTLHGMDTLEEMADKEQFFRKLAADVSGTLDFSQLNKALDETNSDKEASDELEASGPDITSTARNDIPASKEVSCLSGLQQNDEFMRSTGPKNYDEERMVLRGGTLKDASNRFLSKVDLMDSLASSAVINNPTVSSGNIEQPGLLEIEGRGTEQTGIHSNEASKLSDEEGIRDLDGEQSRDSKLSAYSSDSPPSESLRSIKEIAKVRIEKAKEKALVKPPESMSSEVDFGKSSNSKKSARRDPSQDSRNSSSGLSGKSAKLMKSKEIRKRTLKGSVSSANSSRKGSMDGELAFESTDKSIKPTKTKSSLSRLPSGKRSENVSSDLSRLPRFKKQSLHEGEALSTRITEITRERQLQTELYELRAEFNKLLDENEHLHKELDKLKRVSNEKEIRLRQEFETEMLEQKVATLEKQLKKAQELRIRRDSEDDINEEASKEVERMKKEIKEQELLLNGYQLENERLFQEMKKKDSEKKASQSNLVEDNQRLKSAMAENELKRDRLSKQVEELHREIEQLKAARTKGQNGPSNEFIEKLKSFESENVVLRKDISALKEKAENDHHLIKDLERQRNEMEKIINRRYPDGVPGLLQDSRNEPKNNEDSASRAINFLESKLKRLEKELDKKDEETSRLLCNTELRYKDMAKKYEGHIEDLQKHLIEMKRKKSPRGAAAKEESVRGFTPGDEIKDFEAEKSNRKEDKERKRRRKEEIALLQTNERMETNRIREIEKENIDMKLAIEDLRMNSEKEKARHSTTMARMEEEFNRIRLDCRAEIEDIKLSNLKEMNELKSEKTEMENLVKHLQNDNTNLQRNVADQDLIIEKLKQKVLQSDVDKELLHAAKVKEEVLNNKVEALKKELDGALECQPLEHQRFRVLEMKIASMQQRQTDREGELRSLLRKVEPMFVPGGQDSHWRKIVEEKNEQIKQFREELDSILDVLKHLMRNQSVMPFQL